MKDSYRRLLDRLSRVTSGSRYMTEVDGLRFLAIATVFLYHAGTHAKRTLTVPFAISPENTLLDWFTRRGGLGVDVFFAISGFILALPFAMHYLRGAAPIRLKAYFLRRLTRLEPPYIITLAGFFVLLALTGAFTWAEGRPHFLASLFYSHNIIYDRWSTINPVAWSLEVEVQFYILAPLLFLIFRVGHKSTRRLILAGAALAFLVFSILAREPIEAWHLRKSLLVEIPLFLTGILVADLYVAGRLEEQPQRRRYDLLGVAGLLLLLVLKEYYWSIPARAAYVLGVGLLLYGAFRGRWLNRLFRIRTLAVIGGMCYTIYLIHYALIAFTAQLTHRFTWTDSYVVNYWLQACLFVLVVLPASAVFFLLVEKPCMRKGWYKELWGWVKGRFSPVISKKVERKEVKGSRFSVAQRRTENRELEN